MLVLLIISPTESIKPLQARAQTKKEEAADIGTFVNMMPSRFITTGRESRLGRGCRRRSVHQFDAGEELR